MASSRVERMESSTPLVSYYTTILCQSLFTTIAAGKAHGECEDWGSLPRLQIAASTLLIVQSTLVQSGAKVTHFLPIDESEFRWLSERSGRFSISYIWWFWVALITLDNMMGTEVPISCTASSKLSAIQS